MNTKILNDLGFKETDIGAGTVLIREGADNSDVYVLISGKVEVTMRGQTVAVIDAPGAALGEVAILLGQQPVATSTAVEKSTVYVISDFLAFLRAHPEACISTAQTLAAQMVSCVNHMVWMKEQLAGLQKAIDIYVPAFPTPPETSPPPSAAA